MVSTFMPEALQQGHIIQPQQLTGIHVIGQDVQFNRGVSEQQVRLSKKRRIKELEALHLVSVFAKQPLNNSGECLGEK